MEHLQIVENIKSSTALTKHRRNTGKEGGGEKSCGGGGGEDDKGKERLSASVDFSLDKLVTSSGRCSSLIDQGLLSWAPKVLHAKQDRGENTHFTTQESEDSLTQTPFPKFSCLNASNLREGSLIGQVIPGRSRTVPFSQGVSLVQT